MPQGPRELYPNQYFHIIVQSNNHQYVFKEDHDFQKFLGLIQHYFCEWGIKLFHYILMNTHIHCVVKLPDNPEYFYYYKFKYGWDGSLWRKRYKSELIDADRYMLGCGLYIEHNPVKAGIVKSAEDYPWSSYCHWIGKRKDPFLSEHPLDVKNYKDIAQDYINAYLDYIRLSSVRMGA